MGFTHVELLPVMEHPFYGSWGYQTTGYFSPTSRYGTPEDLMYLIDQFHQEGMGVILDWSAAHFPGDAHGLHCFDGTHLFEHEDPRQGFHPEWQTYIFNYGRNEVRSFLMSSAMFWLERFHADGLRIDAVASMLYLDYSRKDGQWVANGRGGNENLDAVTFLKELNEIAYRNFPGVMMIAEDSTTWPGVTRSTSANGLGFGQKWMMGWMHDILNYFHRPFDERPDHQKDIAFSIGYAFDENFMLPLSHDEVVHGKGSLIEKMYGTTTQKFANLRCLFSYMFMHPGTKLVFMGSEFAQLKEWYHDDGLQWNLLQSSAHIGIHELIKDLNGVYKTEKALHRFNFNDRGFSWIDCSDRINSVIAFSRNSVDKRDSLVVMCNFQTRSHQQYQLGVPHSGSWKLIFNSDLEKYGGSSPDNEIVHASSSRPLHGYHNSLTVALPPLSVLVFKRV